MQNGYSPYTINIFVADECGSYQIGFKFIIEQENERLTAN